MKIFYYAVPLLSETLRYHYLVTFLSVLLVCGLYATLISSLMMMMMFTDE